MYVYIRGCRILVWEDGFCNFGASSTALEMNSSGGHESCSGASSVYGNSSCDQFQQYQGLQPELFFKMSHEIYNYGEGYVRHHFIIMYDHIYTYGLCIYLLLTLA